MRVAKEVNRIRFNQGDDCQRLTQAFRQAVLSLDAGYTNDAWGKGSSCRYTPTSIIKSSAEIIEQPYQDSGVWYATSPPCACRSRLAWTTAHNIAGVQSKIYNTQSLMWVLSRGKGRAGLRVLVECCSLSLAGQCVPLRDLVHYISSYKGKPCCTMDPANTDPGFQALRSCVLQIKASKQQVAQEVCLAYTIFSFVLMCSFWADQLLYHPGFHPFRLSCMVHIFIRIGHRVTDTWQHSRKS